MSKRRKNPPPNARERIEEYTLKNYGVDAMTKLFGVSREVFYRWLKENPELDEARQVSLGFKEKENTDRLEKAAAEGNIAAMIYLQKARFHWSDNPDTRPVSAVQVNIQLPSAIPLDQYKAQIIAQHPELTKDTTNETQEAGGAISVDRA